MSAAGLIAAAKTPLSLSDTKSLFDAIFGGRLTED